MYQRPGFAMRTQLPRGDHHRLRILTVDASQLWLVFSIRAREGCSVKISLLQWLLAKLQALIVKASVVPYVSAPVWRPWRDF